MTGTGGEFIRRLILAAGVVTLVFAATPRLSSAAFTLALPASDYPIGSQVTALPATNHNVDVQLGPVHRNAFGRLRRRDGEGWLQAAIWRFTTGQGGTLWHHRTIFLYAVNVFHNRAQAAAAVVDEKIPTHASKAGRLPDRLYRVSDVHGTLVYLFFAYRQVEVEAYYEYRGVAPAATARLIQHHFSTQASHLAHFAQLFSALLHKSPKPTRTPVATSTSTAVATATSVQPATSTVTPTSPPVVIPTNTALPLATVTAISTAVPTATSAPTVAPTATPAGLVITATPGSASYHVRDTATISVSVQLNGLPLAGVSVEVTYFFPGNGVNCVTTTDATGRASCSTIVPVVHTGTMIGVNVEVVTVSGETSSVNTSFTIQ